MTNADGTPEADAQPTPEAADSGLEQPRAAPAVTPADEERPDTGTQFPPPAPRRDGVSRVLAVLALLMALAAAAGSGFLFWQYRQFYVALDAADESARGSLERARAELRAVRDELEELAAEQRAAARELTAQRAELASLPPRFADLEQRFEALQGISADARRRWLRAEAEYLLGVANAELTLAGNFRSATAALELADGKLRELGNPRFTPVREQIAAELASLRAVRLPDVEGLSLTMASLVRGVEQMPLVSRSPDVYDPRTQEPDDLEPGVERAWASLKSALKGMVSIERRDTPVSPRLAPADERLVRGTLELELTAARLALLRGQAEPYQQSLRAARGYLDRYFDAADAEVVSALTLVAELADINVAPPRPDISSSLNLLRQIAVAEDGPR